MQAVILCAGEGERLEPYTAYIPKPLLPVGGVPCLRMIVERIGSYDFFDQILIIVSDKFHKNFEYEFRNDPFIRILNGGEPSGTAGELKKFEDELDNVFYVHYGDELTPIDIGDLVTQHQRFDPIATLAAINLKVPVGILDTMDEKVEKIREKPLLKMKMWTGMAVFNKKILSYCDFGDDISSNALPKALVKENVIFKLYNVDWVQIGDIQSYKMANEVLK